MSSIKDLLKDLKADNMSTKNVEKKKWYVCEKCGKTLSNYHSLWRHKKKCTSNHLDGLTDREESILPQDEKITSGAKPLHEKSVNIQPPADHKRDCRNKIPILKLKWNGSAWQRVNSCEKLYYQMKLGRDLDNLVRKRAINEDVLNATQKSYLQMYREMFTD